MKMAMDETSRRRARQIEYNTAHGITPATIVKAVRSGIESEVKARRTVQEAVRANESEFDQTEIIRLLEEEMIDAAKNLEFERAAQLRDKINDMKGAPAIKSGSDLMADRDPEDRSDKIWQPKSKGRGGGKRKIAK
jgi:excinuclease ABC subunit B